MSNPKGPPGGPPQELEGGPRRGQLQMNPNLLLYSFFKQGSVNYPCFNPGGVGRSLARGWIRCSGAHSRCQVSAGRGFTGRLSVSLSPSPSYLSPSLPIYLAPCYLSLPGQSQDPYSGSSHGPLQRRLQ